LDEAWLPASGQPPLLKEVLTMKALTIVLLTLIAAAMPLPASAACEPYGLYENFFNHIANGWPNENACWGPNRVAFVTVSSCTYTSYGYKFGYGGSIGQTVQIPSDATYTGWEFSYRLDFIDPNKDNFNVLQVKILDLTTGQILATDSYGGAFPDLTCATRILRFSGNLAGHTLRVSFSGQVGYSNTQIIVRRIELWQYPQ
jgi:hypothetical protein